jgi:hypothetical protein
VANWPRLIGAWGHLRHALALNAAFGGPAGRRLSQLGLDRALRRTRHSEAVPPQQRHRRIKPPVNVVHLHRHLPHPSPVRGAEAMQHAQLVAWLGLGKVRVRFVTLAINLELAMLLTMVLCSTLPSYDLRSRA